MQTKDSSINRKVGRKYVGDNEVWRMTGNDTDVHHSAARNGNTVLQLPIKPLDEVHRAIAFSICSDSIVPREENRAQVRYN